MSQPNSQPLTASEATSGPKVTADYDMPTADAGPGSQVTSDTADLSSRMEVVSISPATAPDVVPSTRPSMPAPSVSKLSNITQALSTPARDLPSTAPVSTPVEAVQDADVDPEVAALQAMFPDFDVVILQSVLEASRGDQAVAIDTLLGMSDPEYKAPAATAYQPNQTELDEQYARQLFEEEEQAAGQQQMPPYDQQQVPYQTRQNAPQNRMQGSSPGSAGEIGTQFRNFISGASSRISGSNFGRGGAGNGVQEGGAVGSQQPPEFRQQFNELAETGRKHFNTFYTRVKAKIQEYDPPLQNNTGNQQPATGAMGGQQSSNPYAQAQSATYSAMPSYANNEPAQSRVEQPYAQPQMSQGGYNVDPSPPSSPSRQEIPAATPNPTVLGVPSSLVQRSSFDQVDAPRASFDTSRFGLKPKRPVSLIGGNTGTQPQSPTAAKGKTRATDDDDEIEYVTSPFDDR